MTSPGKSPHDSSRTKYRESSPHKVSDPKWEVDCLVSHSSEEASDDRGAKGWQNRTNVKGKQCPYTDKTVTHGQRNWSV